MRIFLQTPPAPDRVSRFYQLILQEDLLGGWSVVRQWGATGQRGTTRTHYFDDHETAAAALEAWRREKVDDGYRITFVEGEGAR